MTNLEGCPLKNGVLDMKECRVREMIQSPSEPFFIRNVARTEGHTST